MTMSPVPLERPDELYINVVGKGSEFIFLAFVADFVVSSFPLEGNNS